MAYVVQLKDFEGPLDLLLHLISQGGVNIRDIFVSEITGQYLQSIEDLSGLDMDAASSFCRWRRRCWRSSPRAAAQAAQDGGRGRSHRRC